MNSNSHKGNNTKERLTEERPPAMPRWVKVSGIIGMALALLFIGMHLFSGGKMGPMSPMHHMGNMPSSSGKE